MSANVSAMHTGFVDVWRGDLASEARRLAELERLLNDGERERALSFRNRQARERFVVGRGMLREVLAGYLCRDPRGLQFATGEHGKPFLLGESLCFNLSHSGDCWLLAVSDMAAIGVDVENIRPRSGMQAIARRCFSENEYGYWLSLPELKREQAFFRLWTLKEAFVKAVGRGIALGLEQCEIDTLSFAGFASVPDEHGPAAAWGLKELEVGVDHLAALVTPNRDYAFRWLPI